MNKYIFFTKAIFFQTLKIFLILIGIVLVESLILGSIMNSSNLSELAFQTLINFLPLLTILTTILVLNFCSSIYFMKPEFIYKHQEDLLQPSSIWDFPNGSLIPDDNNPPIQYPVSAITLHLPRNFVEKKKILMTHIPFALVKQFSSSGFLSFFNASKLLLPKALAESDIVRIPRAGLSLQKNQPAGDLLIRIRPMSSSKYYILVLFVAIFIGGIALFYVTNLILI